MRGSLALGLVLAGPDTVLRDRDRVARQAAVVERGRAPIPVLWVAGTIAFDGAVVDVGIATLTSPGIEGQELSRFGVAALRPI